MLAWEGDGNASLSQLEALPGNILHPETFPFPIRLCRIEGANYHTVVEKPSTEVLGRMIGAAREMVEQGVRAITTSCGFNAIFQNELAGAVPVPVFSSSLMQVPLVYHMLGLGRRVGIVTADKRHLTPAHLRCAGISESVLVAIAGIEDTGEFAKIRQDPKAPLHAETFINEVVAVAKRLVASHRDIGALVLECTDLPPAAAALRRETGLPVFDITTLTTMLYNAVAGPGWPTVAP